MADAIRTALADARLPDPDELSTAARQRAALNALTAAVPGLGALLATARELVDAAGGVIVENCAVQPDAVVAVLSSAFGTVDPAGNGIPSRLVFDVTPRLTPTGLSQAGTSRGTGYFGLHSDSAMFVRPHAFVTLACVRAEPGHGGESLAVSAEAIARELLARGAEQAVRVLAQPTFPFAGTCSHEDVVYGRILWQHGGRWYVRYREQPFAGTDGGARLSDEQVSALAVLHEVLAQPGLVHEFALRPNDLWVLDNRRWLHGRRQFTAAANRLLKRCKVLAAPDDDNYPRESCFPLNRARA
jgi:hypothetical protein